MHKLANIPDLQDWSALQSWLTGRIATLASLRADGVGAGSLSSLSLDSSDLVSASSPGNDLGHYADRRWRQFVVATLLADWACYPAAVDRVSLARLQYVLHTFPQGFRSWWLDSAADGWLPVGYSGFYPIAESTFRRLRDHPETIDDRAALIPLRRLSQRPYLYVFNYSMVAPFRTAPWTRPLLTALAGDLEATHYRGLCAIVVSEAGARVARRMSMLETGSLVIDGATERAFCLQR